MGFICNEQEQERHQCLIISHRGSIQGNISLLGGIGFYITRLRLSGRLHVPIVGPIGRSDWSVRLVGPTIVSCKRFVRPSDRRLKNQTCLISSDCRSDYRSVWTLRPTGRTDWPVGRPITLQRRRYYNQLAGHIDVIDR